MKITKQKLIKIIKEELDAALAESKSPMPIEGLTDTEWEFWKSTFDEAVDAGADVEEASDHANAEVITLRNAETSDPLPTNDDDEWGRQDEDDFDAYVKAARTGGASYDEAEAYAQSMIDRLRPDAQSEDLEEDMAAEDEEMRKMVRRTYEEDAAQMGLRGAEARAYVKDMMMRARPRTDS